MDRLSHLEKLLESEPGDVFLHYAIAMEFLSLERPADAIAKLKDIRASFPDYLPVYYQLGQTLEQTGNHEEAVQAYEAGMLLATSQKDMKTYGELRSALEELTF